MAGEKETFEETTPDIAIDQVDFDELATLEQSIRGAEEQLNRVSGLMYRLSKDQDTLFTHERGLAAQLDSKRKEIVRRYKLDDTRQWKIDVNTRKIVYMK